MPTEEYATARVDNGGPLQRLVKRCDCPQQAAKSWGYALWKWIGGRKPWHPIGTATHVDDVAKYAEKKNLQTILIKCQGCGAEILRQYPSNGQNTINVKETNE